MEGMAHVPVAIVAPVSVGGRSINRAAASKARRVGLHRTSGGRKRNKRYF